jgi:hypothetical protein
MENGVLSTMAEVDSPEGARRAADAHQVVLCTNLDRSLLKTDLLYESLAALLRGQPLHGVAFSVWLLGGKALENRACPAHEC